MGASEGNAIYPQLGDKQRMQGGHDWLGELLCLYSKCWVCHMGEVPGAEWEGKEVLWREGILYPRQ